MYRLFLVGMVVAAFATQASAAPACAGPSGATKASALSWITGSWVQANKDVAVREHWSGPYGGALLGFGATTKANALRSYEFFRIAETPEGVSYFASPNAAPPTEFKAIKICSDSVVFENKAHDFPQRVIYSKGKDGGLNARIEGQINGKLEGEDWSYRPEK